MEQHNEPTKSKKTLRNIIVTIVAVGIAVGAYLAWSFFFRANVPETLQINTVEIPTGSKLDDVVAILKKGNFIKDENTFRMMAQQLKYKGRAGRFELQPGWSNFKLVRHLRGGQQAPVKVVLVNERLLEEVAAKVARFIEPDSVAFITLFNDPVFLDSIGYEPHTLMSLFIPNTYEFFWNTSPRKFMERMVQEHDNFWKKEGRQAKADSLGLNREQVYTLASIVERETNANSEKPRMAGVYLNRLKLGMMLQADPTLVFASRDWESRDLAQYKSLDSPYNTYMYTGLPPGPISMASIPSLDAVLNPEKHDYIFFVAVGDGSGLHMFSETYDGHKVNIERYKANLLKRNLGLSGSGKAGN
jgi:UPF0755 protein